MKDPSLVMLRKLESDNSRLQKRKEKCTTMIVQAWEERKTLNEEIELNNEQIKEIESWLKPLIERPS